MDVRRYLLVLDMDLLAVDEQCELGPISFLVARREHEKCEVWSCPWPRTGHSQLRRC